MTPEWQALVLLAANILDGLHDFLEGIAVSGRRVAVSHRTGPDGGALERSNLRKCMRTGPGAWPLLAPHAVRGRAQAMTRHERASPPLTVETHLKRQSPLLPWLTMKS